MALLQDLTLKGFLDVTASNAPVPGGGSVSALSASISAALTEMVALSTIGKKGFEEVEAEMKKIVEESLAFRNKFVQNIDDDAASFDKVMAAFKMPKETDDEKKARSAAIQEAYKIAATVPLEVAENAFKLFALCDGVVSNGKPDAVTDGAVATLLARTAVIGALYNVKINIGSIKDEAFVADVKKRVEAIESKISETESAILAKANAKI